MEAKIYSIEELYKARVEPFVRTKKGKLERVRGFERKGEKVEKPKKEKRKKTYFGREDNPRYDRVLSYMKNNWDDKNFRKKVLRLAGYSSSAVTELSGYSWKEMKRSGFKEDYGEDFVPELAENLAPSLIRDFKGFEKKGK